MTVYRKHVTYTFYDGDSVIDPPNPDLADYEPWLRDNNLTLANLGAPEVTPDDAGAEKICQRVAGIEQYGEYPIGATRSVTVKLYRFDPQDESLEKIGDATVGGPES